MKQLNEFAFRRSVAKIIAPKSTFLCCLVSSRLSLLAFGVEDKNGLFNEGASKKLMSRDDWGRVRFLCVRRSPIWSSFSARAQKLSVIM